MTSLIRLEAINFAATIFDTEDLSTVRGGSLAAAVTVLEVSAKLHHEYGARVTTVSSGGSIGLFLLADANAPEDGAADIVTKIRKWLDDPVAYGWDVTLSRALREVHFVIVAVPVDGDPNAFYRSVVKSQAAVRRIQLQRANVTATQQVAAHLRAPFICQKDAVRRAVCMNGVEWVSDSVDARRSYGTREKKGEFYRRIARSNSNMQLPGTITYTHDFDELTDCAPTAALTGKMALLALDGNGFGQYIADHCRNTNAYSAFDAGLRKCLSALLYDLVVLSSQNGGRASLEVFLWAGDDLMILVPAHRALRVLDYVYGTFVPALRQATGAAALTYRAGVVFCHHTAPIRGVKQLASELQELARGTVGSERTDTIAYEILESFDHIGHAVDEHRKRHCPDPDLRAGLCLTGSTLSTGLQPLAQLLAVIPRRTLRRIEIGLRSNDPSVRAEASERAHTFERAELETGEWKETLDAVRRAFNNDSWWLHASTLANYLIDYRSKENAATI
jgi:hypothetical protein